MNHPILAFPDRAGFTTSLPVRQSGFYVGQESVPSLNHKKLNIVCIYIIMISIHKMKLVWFI